MDGNLEPLAQFFGETLHLLRLDAFSPAHAQGIAHNDLGTFVVTDHLFQLTEVQTLVLPLDGFESLRGNAKQVRNGYANPLGTHVQTQNSAETPRARRLRLDWFGGHVWIISPRGKAKKGFTMLKWPLAKPRPRRRHRLRMRRCPLLQRSADIGR